MKRLLISLSILALVGAGCFGGKTVEDNTPPPNTTAYENSEFGFAFNYPPIMDIHVRKESTRPNTYIGMDVDFFASMRDIDRDVKATNIIYMYSVPSISVDEFVEKLEASDEAIKLLQKEEIEINEIKLTKLTNSTARGIDKFHYLFESGDKTIILSVFLMEHELFDPVLQTIRKFE